MSLPTLFRPVSVARISVLVFASLLARPASCAEEAPQRPKLVLMITVDQLRGDMLPRFEHRFEAGLRQLMEHGLLYTNAHYDYATTFTAVGHATLATGASPIDHGIVGNGWYETGRGPVYCVQDERHRRSPRNMTSTTVGDELIMSTAGVARVFSVSVKDRAAILPGGHLGKAFWYDPRSGRFVTSSYYYEDEPGWLNELNAQDRPARWVGESWTLLHDLESYVYGRQDDREYEAGRPPLGNTFPHPLGDSKAAVYASLRATPFGDQLLLELAQALMTAEQVGRGRGTDLMAISFSASDYVGHAFGPNSLEAEDNLLHLDRTLGELLTLVDEQVGLDRTVVVLSSDHGVDAIPGYRRELMQPAKPAARSGSNGSSAADLPPAGAPADDFCHLAGRLVGNHLMAEANRHLQKLLGIDHDLIVRYGDPGFYLDPEAVARANLSLGADETSAAPARVDLALVESALAELLRAQPGVARAFTRSDLMQGNVPSDAVAQRVLRSFHPQRSASVAIVQDQGWYLWEGEGGAAAMHGSPYTYDTHVPILMMGTGITPGRSARPVDPQDIAPTLAQILGILAPSGCSGEVLHEAIPANR